VAVGNHWEQLRSYYLQTLAVVQYAPRELAEEASADSLDTPAEAVQEQQAAYTSQQQPIPDTQVDGNDSPSTKKQQLAKPATVVPTEDTDLKLTFVLWQASEELLIASAVEDQLPDSRQINLLTNIVAAMDKTAPNLPQFEVVKWPLHAHMQGGETEAREFLSTLIDTRMATKSVKTLLLLGESTAQWLLSSQQDISLEKGIYPLSGTATALVVSSLSEMLTDPDCKRVTWGTLCRYLPNPSVR